VSPNRRELLMGAAIPIVAASSSAVLAAKLPVEFGPELFHLLFQGELDVAAVVGESERWLNIQSDPDFDKLPRLTTVAYRRLVQARAVVASDCQYAQRESPSLHADAAAQSIPLGLGHNEYAVYCAMTPAERAHHNVVECWAGTLSGLRRFLPEMAPAGRVLKLVGPRLKIDYDGFVLRATVFGVVAAVPR
jgi:hypothetical protein